MLHHHQSVPTVHLTLPILIVAKMVDADSIVVPTVRIIPVVQSQHDHHHHLHPLQDHHQNAQMVHLIMPIQIAVQMADVDSTVVPTEQMSRDV